MASGLCPTDVRIFKFGSSAVKPPVTMGHEFSGIVAEAVNVESLSRGKRVNIPADLFCGKCYMYRIGRENLCEDSMSFGYNVDGSHAEYVKIPRRASERGLYFRIPPEISFEEATFTEPLACCINSIETMKISSDKSIAVIGDGPIGLLHIQLAKLYGQKNNLNRTS